MSEGSRKTPAAVTGDCSRVIEEYLGVDFYRESRAKFLSICDKYAVCILVSKDHGNKYWFGIFDHQVAWFDSQNMPNKMFALACGGMELIFLFSATVFESWKELLSNRYLPKRDKQYWHINIIENNGVWYLMTKKGHEDISLEEYMIGMNNPRNVDLETSVTSVMDATEFRHFISTISEFLAVIKRKVKDEPNDLNEIEVIEDRCYLLERNYRLEEGHTAPSSEIINNYFGDLMELVANLSIKYKEVENYAEKVNFGPNFWLWKYESPLPHGYSDEHIELRQGQFNPNGRHVYSSEPPQIKWNLKRIEQQGSNPFYMAIVSINEIDAVSTVPAINDTISTAHASGRVLTKTLAPNQWQRAIDPKRLLKIGKFLDDSKNGIANAPMIYAPKHDSVVFETNADGDYTSILINFDFLKPDTRNSSNMTDHERVVDKRPLQIIDGQHRIRGAMRSKRGKELLIPIIVFPPEIGSEGAAKYFAEINTLSEPLNTLHELFMRHRFQLSSTKKAFDYSPYDGTNRTYRARANNLSYEAAAHCNINSISMESLIQVLDENPEKNHILDVDMWVKHSYHWFMPTGPYGPESKRFSENKEDWFEEIGNYFDAFEVICNSGWKDERPRWLKNISLKGNDKGGNRPYIQYRTTIRALMHQFTLVTQRIRESGYAENIISKSRFETGLKPLGNIDWLDRRIKSNYIPAGGGEYAWKCLRQWFTDSLKRGEIEPYNEHIVMSESTPSESGKGILSPPEKGEIWFEDDEHQWPIEDKPVRILSRRPINAYHIAEAFFADENGTMLNEMAKVNRTAKSNLETGICVFTISYGDWVKSRNSAKMTITWGNSVTKEVSNVIELSKLL